MPSPILPAFGVGLLTACWWLLRRHLFPTSVINNLPGPPAESWLSGSLNQLYSRKAWDLHRQLVETYGSVFRIKGFCGAPSLFVYDPETLHHVLLKDQYIYEETDAFVESSRMLFGDGLFSAMGQKHRRMRKMLNPVFSIVHMREMIPIFYEIGHKLQDSFMKMTHDGPKEVDMYSWTTRLSLELIGRGGLGYSFDTLEENSIPHPYSDAVRKIMRLSAGSNTVLKERLLPVVTRLGTPRFRRLLVDLLPPLHPFRDLVDTMHEATVKIFEEKKKAVHEGGDAFSSQLQQGKDAMTILMKANLSTSSADKLSDPELLGQISSLTFAATDITSGALCHILQLLSTHREYQIKLRDEIRNALLDNGGHDIDHNTLVSLPYLDAICRETLRLHPPVSFLTRTAREDAILPVGSPIKGRNGEEITEIPIPKGTDIIVGILASNTNPKLWGPDSYEWKPERWLNPLPQALIDARIPGVYSHLLTFFGGARSCLGFKFSQLEMKVMLTLLLDAFEFSLSDKPVVWHMSGISSPYADFEAAEAAMPIVISRAP